MRQQGYHESLEANDLKKKVSERSFGLTISCVLLLLAAWLWWHGKNSSLYCSLGGLAFGGLALVAPRALKIPNLLWSKLGEILHHAISPIIISAIFFLIFTPVGLLMRALGQRPLALGFDPSAPTYWVRRAPPGPARGTLTRQF